MLGKKIIFISSDKDGCGWYRTKLIADYLQEGHCWFFPATKDDNENLSLQDKDVLGADIIVIQRHVHEFFLTLIPELQAKGKKFIYDLDDNLWNIPASNPAHNFFPSKILKTAKKIIQLCDYVTVSTEPLKQFMLKENFNTKIEVVPNMLPDIFDYKEKSNEKVRIGYAGSPTHVGDFSFGLCNALRTMKKEYDCELIFMGYNPLKGAETEFTKGVQVSEYLTTLNNLNLDIAIAPLADNMFNQCKSNLKFLEYSACGVATIASSVYPYAKTIQSDYTGLLAINDKQWLGLLEELVKDSCFRNDLSRSAHKFVNENFTYKNNGKVVRDKWEAIVRSLYDIH